MSLKQAARLWRYYNIIYILRLKLRLFMFRQSFAWTQQMYKTLGNLFVIVMKPFGKHINSLRILSNTYINSFVKVQNRTPDTGAGVRSERHSSLLCSSEGGASVQLQVEVCTGLKLKPEPGPYPRLSDPTRPDPSGTVKFRARTRPEPEVFFFFFYNE